MFNFVVLVMGVQLMLLPQLLKEELAEDISIGFYLTSPFPSSEVYRCLPRTPHNHPFFPPSFIFRSKRSIARHAWCKSYRISRLFIHQTFYF